MYSTLIRLISIMLGITDNIYWRIKRHNMGWGKYTKRGIPWKLAYHETYQNKKEALRREREIKDKKSRKYIEKLIYAGGRPE